MCGGDLVGMTDTDPALWALIADPAALLLPKDRPARVLLFVHGTFSSTIGGYGGADGNTLGPGIPAGCNCRQLPRPR